jgi:Flp pilus assembly protein, pilin Flp
VRAVILSVLASEKGATAVEYGLILSLIVLAIVGGVSQLASSTVGMWDNVSAEVNNY